MHFWNWTTLNLPKVTYLTISVGQKMLTVTPVSVISSRNLKKKEILWQPYTSGRAGCAVLASLMAVTWLRARSLRRHRWSVTRVVHSNLEFGNAFRFELLLSLLHHIDFVIEYIFWSNGLCSAISVVIWILPILISVLCSVFVMDWFFGYFKLL